MTPTIGLTVLYSFKDPQGTLISRPAVITLVDGGLVNLTVFTNGGPLDTETAGPNAILRKMSVEFSTGPAEGKWSTGPQHPDTLSTLSNILERLVALEQPTPPAAAAATTDEAL